MSAPKSLGPFLVDVHSTPRCNYCSDLPTSMPCSCQELEKPWAWTQCRAGRLLYRGAGLGSTLQNPKERAHWDQEAKLLLLQRLTINLY